MEQSVILYDEQTKVFHIRNNWFSYIMKIDKFGKLLHLYFGEKVSLDNDYSYLVEFANRPMAVSEESSPILYSYEHLKQEFPEYGSSDFRQPAIKVRQPNGSSATDFTYCEHLIFNGKPQLNGLPASYVENDQDAKTLLIKLHDEVSQLSLLLNYTVFTDHSVIARSVQIFNVGTERQIVERLMPLSIDIPDKEYQMMQLSGAWGRERYIKTRSLEQGIQSISSNRGHSSHNHNPFLALKRKETNEFTGQVIGATYVYSGDFQAQVEVDTYDVTRLQIGMNPDNFSWELLPGMSFQSPEVLMVYSKDGLNGMSHAFHSVLSKHVVRGIWRDKPRPIMLNNWEATYFDFTEDKLLALATKAKEAGIELFVLDDGWFGKRNSDTSGLGDWFVNHDKLPNGIDGLSKKIQEMGLKFGLWIEPEMVNMDSELYRKHPDWLLHIPNRKIRAGRNQHVLNFSHKEVVDYIYDQLYKVLISAEVSYIKWDMNRSISEAFDNINAGTNIGEIRHRYILGVYDLYERLRESFPGILFESCASGGGRFDAGMLYYAPQTWASDCTDAVERLKIQYGTSLLYPLSSMGAHVSIVPNHQINRVTSLSMRSDVSLFGVYGYELDLNELTEAELNQIKSQVDFYKKYRDVFQYGRFYRLQSPFEGNIISWMVVSNDKKTAICGYYKVLNDINAPFKKLHLKGLDPSFKYHLKTTSEIPSQKSVFYGDELMNIGFITTDASSGQYCSELGLEETTDFSSRVFVFEA